MFITPIKPMESMDFTAQSEKVSSTTKTGFASILENAVKEYQQASAVADNDSYNLSIGNADDLAQIQINSLKAEAMLQTTVQLTSRVVNAYKEVMQTQV